MALFGDLLMMNLVFVDDDGATAVILRRVCALSRAAWAAGIIGGVDSQLAGLPAPEAVVLRSMSTCGYCIYLS